MSWKLSMHVYELHYTRDIKSKMLPTVGILLSYSVQSFGLMRYSDYKKMITTSPQAGLQLTVK